jgi:CHAT domain-containing protein
MQDDGIEPALKRLARMHADEYRVTSRVAWAGADALAGHQQMASLIETHHGAVAGLSGAVGRAARYKLLDLRIQSGHMALRAHRPSLAAEQLVQMQREDVDEATKRFAIDELRAAVALAVQDYDRALEVMDEMWARAPRFLRDFGVLRAGQQIGRASVLASLGRWAEADRELDAIRVDASYLSLVDQYAGLRTVVRSMLGREDPDFEDFVALEPKYRDGGQGVDRSLLYFAARTAVFERRGSRGGAMADTVQAVDAGRRFSRFLRLQQAAGASDRSAMAPLFLRIAKEAYLLATLRGVGRSGITMDDALDAVQLLQNGDIDRDVAAAALRLDAIPGISAGDLRQVQDLQRASAAAQGALAAALGAVDADAAESRRRVDRANAAAAELDQTLSALTRRAPGVRYAFGGGPPESVRDVQTRLAADEALLCVVPMSASTLVLLVTKRRVEHHLAPVGRPDLAALVERVRRSTDLSGYARLPDFDIDAARRLHRALLGWRPQGLRGLKSLTVSASGPLAALPFGLLVADARQREPGDDYRRLPWLIRSVALTHVPSVSSWLALSRAPGSTGARGFVAWADPDFAGDGVTVDAPSTGIRAAVPAAAQSRAAVGDPVSAVAALPPLPETRREAQVMARVLQTAGRADVIVGAAATRRSVLDRSSSGDLAQRSVVLFATHGLVPFQVPGLDQPALAMAHDASDPGASLLTLEDVLGLRLGADWVILSACSTASADRDGGDPMSGLSRGFLFAGARALLVTHWEVESESAAEITTRTVEAFAGANGLSRAQALQRASLALIDGRETPTTWAHPAYWAPFVVVGDGSRTRAAGTMAGPR